MQRQVRCYILSFFHYFYITGRDGPYRSARCWIFVSSSFDLGHAAPISGNPGQSPRWTLALQPWSTSPAVYPFSLSPPRSIQMTALSNVEDLFLLCVQSTATSAQFWEQCLPGNCPPQQFNFRNKGWIVKSWESFSIKVLMTLDFAMFFFIIKSQKLGDVKI